ncbi:hypothetical protein X975_20416, partial [Stegodyphus mimosarum]
MCALTIIRMVTRSHAPQHRFALNVCAGIFGDCFVGLYLLPPRLNGRKYLIFLETVLPTFLGAVPAYPPRYVAST